MSKIISKKNYISRQEKHNRTNKLFVCECGKEYIGFTSLYLHFQKKHNGNISTKKGCKNRKVEKIMGKTIYTYYYSRGNFKPCLRTESSFDQENMSFSKEESFCSLAYQKTRDAVN